MLPLVLTRTTPSMEPSNVPTRYEPIRLLASIDEPSNNAMRIKIQYQYVCVYMHHTMEPSNAMRIKIQHVPVHMCLHAPFRAYVYEFLTVS